VARNAANRGLPDDQILGLFPLPDLKAKKRKEFFKERTEQSAVKARITADYFRSWLSIMRVHTRDGRLAYIDLYCGPGTYGSGQESTPLLVLRVALETREWQKMVVAVFRDKKKRYIDELKKNVAEKIPEARLLQHPPDIRRANAAQSDILQYVENRDTIPIFMFLDPFGYSGLSIRLFRAILKNWGCEVLFFFNFNRINLALRNRSVRERMDELFGKERVERLKGELRGARSAFAKERIILAALRAALNESGAKIYMLPFRFRPTQKRISHHLVFCTKNAHAQKIMKDIMARESSSHYDGVASFEFAPHVPAQAPVTGAEPPLETLGKELLVKFAGRRMTVFRIYEEHNDGTNYTMKNYRDVLCRLYYEEERIEVLTQDGKEISKASRTRRMSENYIVRFRR